MQSVIGYPIDIKPDDQMREVQDKLLAAAKETRTVAKSLESFCTGTMKVKAPKGLEARAAKVLEFMEQA